MKTLPLELQGFTTRVTKPDIYAFGTVTSLASFLAIFVSLILIHLLRRRIAR